MPTPTLLFRHPHLLVLTVVIILVAGFSALRTMPRLEDPVITNRNPLILVPAPGVDAERVEALIIEPLEQVLREVPAIKTVDATATVGLASVAIELRADVTRGENEEVFADIRDELSRVEPRFPPEALPARFEDNRGAVAFTLITALSWKDGYVGDLGILSRQAEELANRLRNLPGTEYVRRYGDVSEEIRVTLEPHELAALGLPLVRLQGLLGAADAKRAAGFWRDDASRLQLDLKGAFRAVDEVAAVPLRTTADGLAVRLGDIASLERRWQEPVAEIGRSAGRRALYVAARVRSDERVDRWAVRAHREVDAFRETVGAGLAVEVIFDQNVYTSDRLGSLALNLFLGALVVFGVVILTMGWRSALLIGSALPLTAALTLFLVSATGGKLHQMSIFGMIIALGLLIDNAIVMNDEITRRLRADDDRLTALRGAVGHLFGPLLASTLTTILAFMPIVLLPGNAGDFVRSIGSSVIIALASSFFVAMALVSTLTAHFGRDKVNTERRFWRDGLGGPRSGERARRFLRGGIRRPWLSMPAVSIVAAVGFLLATTLGVQFFPRVDRDMFAVRFWLPTSSAVTATAEVAVDMERYLRSHDDIREVHWLLGGSFPSVYYNLVMNKDGTAYYGQAVVYATDFAAVKRLIPKLQAGLDERFPEAQPIVRQFGQGPPTAADVEFRLYGPDLQRLQQLGETVRYALAQHPDILHTRETLIGSEPHLRLRSTREDLRLAGLTSGELAAQLTGSLDGFTAGSVLEGVEEMPVRIRFADTVRGDLEAVRALPVAAGGSPGAWVPLNALGTLELEPQLGALDRRNGERVNTVQGWVRNNALPIDVTRDVQAQLAARDLELPTGYRLEVGGDSENQQEAVGNLTLYVPLLITLTLATLIMTFRSVRLAMLLGVVAGLSVGFGLLATWSLGFPLSFNTILGSLGLVGLAFNSSIVVLASIRANHEARHGDRDAIATATAQTLRHLTSTTFTTMGGFLPLLIFVGGDFWPPLAIVLAGGVFGSTLLALFFTPAAYRLLRPWRPVRALLPG